MNQDPAHWKVCCDRQTAVAHVRYPAPPCVQVSKRGLFHLVLQFELEAIKPDQFQFASFFNLEFAKKEPPPATVTVEFEFPEDVAQKDVSLASSDLGPCNFSPT